MDWIADQGKIQDVVKRYKFVFIFLLVGILLITLPEKQTKEESVPQVSVEQGLEASLEEILSQISGAGNVSVLLTQLQGEQVLYQTDDNLASETVRKETVLISGTDRNETGLVRQVNPPIYQGAVIVCEGADSALVRLNIINAVMSATGLTSDKISVLKMK